MRLLAACGHEFTLPDTGVAPDSVKCAACGRMVAVYGVDLKPDEQVHTDRWGHRFRCVRTPWGWERVSV